MCGHRVDLFSLLPITKILSSQSTSMRLGVVSRLTGFDAGLISTDNDVVSAGNRFRRRGETGWMMRRWCRLSVAGMGVAARRTLDVCRNFHDVCTNKKNNLPNSHTLLPYWSFFVLHFLRFLRNLANMCMWECSKHRRFRNFVVCLSALYKFIVYWFVFSIIPVFVQELA